MTKRSTEYTVTNPITSEPYTFRSSMAVVAVRFLDTGNGRFLPSHHRSIAAALTGPNQTTEWNRYRRAVVEIATDTVVGPQPATATAAAPAPKRNVGPCPNDGCGMQINLAKPCPLCDPR